MPWEEPPAWRQLELESEQRWRRRRWGSQWTGGRWRFWDCWSGGAAWPSPNLQSARPGFPSSKLWPRFRGCFIWGIFLLFLFPPLSFFILDIYQIPPLKSISKHPRCNFNLRWLTCLRPQTTQAWTMKPSCLDEKIFQLKRWAGGASRWGSIERDLDLDGNKFSSNGRK